jgi:hypothetical protein
MPTTFATIRDAQVALIEALTPTSMAGQKFRRHREAVDFMAWVEANPKSVHRKFEIRRNWDDDQRPTSDGSLEGVSHSMELRVAYSGDLGLYGSKNEGDVDRVIDEDRRAIDEAIGINGGHNFVASQHDSRYVAHEVGVVGASRVLSITFSLLYDRSV